MAGKGLGAHRASQALISLITAHAVDPDEPIYPLYTYDTENCSAFVRKLQQTGFACDMDNACAIGPTIATHIGPNAYGLAFVEKKL